MLVDVVMRGTRELDKSRLSHCHQMKPLFTILLIILAFGMTEMAEGKNSRDQNIFTEAAPSKVNQ